MGQAETCANQSGKYVTHTNTTQHTWGGAAAAPSGCAAQPNRSDVVAGFTASLMVPTN